MMRHKKLVHLLFLTVMMKRMSVINDILEVFVNLNDIECMNLLAHKEKGGEEKGSKFESKREGSERNDGNYQKILHFSIIVPSSSSEL